MVDPIAQADPDVAIATDDRRVDEQPRDAHAEPAALVDADLLVEDVSIDGMCGVY